jgi:transposase
LPSKDVIALLGGWEGYRVGTVQRFAAGVQGATPQVWIELVHTASPFVCSGCGRPGERYHDGEERWVRDLPILDAQTHLLVPRYRVDCPSCGPKLERLS